MNIKMDEISIEIKLSEKDNLKATVVIDFGDITVKGFRLSVSEHENENLDWEKLWVQPPSYRAGRGYQKLIFINDIEKWKQIERKIFDIYRAKQSKVDSDNEMHGDKIF